MDILWSFLKVYDQTDNGRCTAKDSMQMGNDVF